MGLHTARAVGAAPTEEGDAPRSCGIRCPGKPKVEEPECALMFFTLGWYHGWDRLGPARVLHRFRKILPPPFAGGSPPHGYSGRCLRVPRFRPLPAPPARCPGTAAEVPCGGTAAPGAARARTRTRRGFSRAPSHTPARAQLTPFCFVLFCLARAASVHTRHRTCATHLPLIFGGERLAEARGDARVLFFFHRRVTSPRAHLSLRIARGAGEPPPPPRAAPQVRREVWGGGCGG